MARRGPALRDEPLGSSDEVVEGVLAIYALACKMPLFPKFGTTTKSRNRE
jgi:hypothetical protein